jgi:hypothetical protein
MTQTAFACESIAGESGQQLRKALDEFDTYIVVNQSLIPNYGERWRNEEAVATGFVESAVNQIVSKRSSKKQQMQWTKKVHIWCFQMRTRCLMNGWKIPFVTGIRTSGQNLKVRSSRRLKNPDFYALLQILHRLVKCNRFCYRFLNSVVLV